MLNASVTVACPICGAPQLFPIEVRARDGSMLMLALQAEGFKLHLGLRHAS